MKKQTVNIAPAKRRPGRPVSTGKGVSITIYIARKDYETLAEIAADNRGTVAAVIKNAVADHIGRAGNAHDDLIDACRAIAALADGRGRANLMEVAGQARAALLKAGGK